VADQIAQALGGKPTLLLALLALASHGTSHAALPPPAVITQQKDPSPAAGSDAKEANEGTGLSWSLPPIQIGGTLQYSLRREDTGDQQRSQTGLTATLRARTRTYIWQPWFANIEGDVAFTSSTDSANAASNSIDNQISGNNSSRNILVTGGARLSVLPRSQFPFEAYFQQSDSRVSSDLAIANSYAGQRFGFLQTYARPQGDATLSWDRTSQTSAESGRDQQDSLQLKMSQRLEKHNLTFHFDRTSNSRSVSSENITQTNLLAQDSYRPNDDLSVESQANISNGTYRLLQGDTTTRVLQLNSTAFWQPDDRPFTVNGGVRVFSLAVDGSGRGNGDDGFQARNQNLNGNVGISYELNQFTRLNANGNVNVTDANGQKSTTTNQSAGVTYQPESIQLGNFRYNWGTSANVSNETGGEESQRQLNLQFTHSLNRSINLEGGSTISMDVNQGLSASAGRRADGASTKRVSHGASITWNTSQESSSSLLRLSMSDSRALDGDRDFFQLINFQASSNLPTSNYSSWSGNLTVQAVRQSNGLNAGTSSLPGSQIPEPDKGFITTSSGSISYQNQRMFGIRRLRFNSDIRLNGEFVLPLFGDSQDQETAAWENQFSYFIGRTQLRLNLLIASTSTPKITVDPVTKAESIDKVKKVNKSIAFTLQRNFGAF